MEKSSQGRPGVVDGRGQVVATGESSQPPGQQAGGTEGQSAAPHEKQAHRAVSQVTP